MALESVGLFKVWALFISTRAPFKEEGIEEGGLSEWRGFAQMTEEGLHSMCALKENIY